VFFNTAGIPYRYETEGYDVAGEWYLPDFWLPHLNCWIEIKGKDNPTARELRLIKLLAQQTESQGFIIPGNIPYPYPSEDWIVGYRWNRDGEFVEVSAASWVQCPVCLKVDIEGGDFKWPSTCACIGELWLKLFRLSVGKDLLPGETSAEEFGEFLEAVERILKKSAHIGLYKTQLLRDAYHEARQARFEHNDPYFQPLSAKERELRVKGEWERILDDLEMRGLRGEPPAGSAATLFGWTKVVGFRGNTLKLAVPTTIADSGVDMHMVRGLAENPHILNPFLTSVRKCCGIQVSRVAVSPQPVD
jgi:hypothetical protein